MKKIIAILVTMIVLAGAVFAAAPTNNSTASLNITCTIAEIQPTLTLEGATSANGTFANADVAFGELEEGVNSITAYFRVSYTKYRWNKTVTVSAAAGNLTSTTTDTVATPNSANPTVENASKIFKGCAGNPGTFANFSVSYNTTNLSAGSYSATVTITYSVE